MRIRFDRVRFLQTGALAALLLVCVSVPAVAQDNTALSTRLDHLENEIQTLNRAVYKGEAPPPSAAAPDSVGGASAAVIQNRLTQMEMSIQALTGKVEELGHDIDRLKDVETRLDALEARTATPQTTPQTPVQANTQQTGAPNETGFHMADPNAPAPETAPTAGRLGVLVTNPDQKDSAAPASAALTPAAAYDSAFNRLRNRDYDGARDAFKAFIQKYPDSKLLPNALYWMGETYYVRNDYVPAARIFAETYQKYPKSSKAPDSLLKLGLSLAGQGKEKDACIALAQLKKQFPSGATPVLTRGDQEIKQLKCDAAP